MSEQPITHETIRAKIREAESLLTKLREELRRREEPPVGTVISFITGYTSPQVRKFWAAHSGADTWVVTGVHGSIPWVNLVAFMDPDNNPPYTILHKP